MFLKFFIYSILGCGLETAWGLIKRGRIENRRMLTVLPMCPVYGIGAIAMSLLLQGFKDNIILLYALGAILAGSVEFVFFALARLAFSVKVWDYSDKPLNFMGGVCGEYIIWWGLTAVVFVRYLDPWVSGLLSGMTAYSELVITAFLGIVTLADAANTIELLRSFKKGNISELPDYFYYMKKIS